MSHRHGDHMGGLAYLLKVNPKVTIYAPKEGFGVYGADLPSGFYRKDSSLPVEQRYYKAHREMSCGFGSAWPGANFQLVDKNTEIAPNIHLITFVSDKPGTLELRELSLAFSAPDGMVIVVGCSHPGIDRIVESAIAINPRIHFIAGGFHLVVVSDPDIEKIVTALHETTLPNANTLRASPRSVPLCLSAKQICLQASSTTAFATLFWLQAALAVAV
jgi:7,8-dihydropterin-6-yl-methyl-4-(beta-D-ribofuranosyl)aminobenzene 5'-phosphate synthase